MTEKFEFPDGEYTVNYANGESRVLRFRTVREGKLAGKQIIGYREGDRFVDFGFLHLGYTLFWRKFRETQEPERLRRITSAVAAVTGDAQEKWRGPNFNKSLLGL